MSTKVNTRLTEVEKKADPETYILNTTTGKYVKRDSPTGKKMIKALETGEEVQKSLTETERLVLVVQTLRDVIDLDDSIIKSALKTIEGELPRGFPSVWGGKHKEGRSPDHPKGPRNAFIYFTKEVRAVTKRANPELSSEEMISLMAEMWNETSIEDRKEYTALAAADKVRYEQEMTVFESNHPDQARAKTKAASTPGKPTKTTAYQVFLDDNREECKEQNPELTGKEINRVLANEWARVKEDADELSEYQLAADKLNEGFEERVVEYHSTPSSKASPKKKLSAIEQAKADDPEHYELNPKTGRYVKKVVKKAAKTEKTEKKVVAKLPARKLPERLAKTKAKENIDEMLLSD